MSEKENNHLGLVSLVQPSSSQFCPKQTRCPCIHRPSLTELVSRKVNQYRITQLPFQTIVKNSVIWTPPHSHSGKQVFIQLFGNTQFSFGFPWLSYGGVHQKEADPWWTKLVQAFLIRSWPHIRRWQLEGTVEWSLSWHLWFWWLMNNHFTFVWRSQDDKSPALFIFSCPSPLGWPLHVEFLM